MEIGREEAEIRTRNSRTESLMNEARNGQSQAMNEAEVIWFSKRTKVFSTEAYQLGKSNPNQKEGIEIIDSNRLPPSSARKSDEAILV